MSASRKPFKSKFSTFDYIIIVLTYLFFPLTLVIALIRTFATHRHNSCKGRNFRLLGWVLFGTYIITLLINILASETRKEFLDDNLFMALAILSPASLFFVLAEKADKKFRNLLKIYTEVVVQRRLIYIDHVAIEANQTPAQAIRDLNYMFRERRLPYGKIENGVVTIRSFNRGSGYEAEIGDRRKDRLQYSLDHDAAAHSAAGQSEIHTDIGPKTVECPGCGARTVVTHDEKKECEYCGTMVS